MRIINKITPRSLYARFLLIIILPVILVQIVAVYMFYERHWNSISRNMASSLSGEISLIVDLLKKSHDDSNQNDLFLNYKKNLFLDIKFESKKNTIPKDQILQEYKFLHQNLQTSFNLPIHISSVGKESNINVQVLLPNGVLSVTAPHKRLANPTTYIFIL